MNILSQFYGKEMILFFCTFFLIFMFLNTMLIPAGNTLVKNGSSFPPTRLFPAPR